MKITDMIISAALKKGILYEARNTEMDIEIPLTQFEENQKPTETKVMVRLKAEHVSIRIEKE